jgi:O-antigen/teichoic acid export membrane protein
MITLAIQFGYNIDNVVIAAVAGTSAVAVYSVAFRVADYQRQLCNQFNGLLFPIVVRFSAADEMASMRATLIDGTRFALGMITGVTICLFAVADRLIVIWMGADFRESLPSLYVLGAAGVVLVGAGPLGNLLLARGRHRLVAYACAGEAAANLMLTLLLVRSFGIIGAAIGTAVSITVSNVFVQMPAACRLLSVPVRRFLAEVAVPAGLASVPAIALAWVFQRVLSDAPLVQVLGAGLLVAAVYLTAFVALGLSRPERARYVGSLRELTTALRAS